MHRPFIARLLLVLLALLSSGWGQSWEEIAQDRGRVQSLQAAFTQEKHLKILTRPIVSKGIFAFRSPASLRWEYLTPVHTILLSHQGASKRFAATTDGQMKEETGMSLDAMEMVLQEIGQWLDGRFNENADFRAELTPGKKITLTPKKEGLAQLIGYIELHLSPRPGVIESVVIHEGPDSYTKMIFEHEELNRELGERVFTER